jgi:hypothetical protein
MDDSERRIVRAAAEMLVTVIEESDTTPAEHEAIATVHATLVELAR